MVLNPEHSLIVPGASAHPTNAAPETRTSKQNVPTTAQTNATRTSSAGSKPKRRSAKKPRLSTPASTAADSSTLASTDNCPTADPLTTLPLELLGEILVRTRSTRDVLAVARCSKHLWKTLTGSPAAFIWKRTRKVAIPQPMPDPPSGGVVSEPVYAMMVFDGGICEFCKKYTKETYSSFALRFRVCINEKCRKTCLTQKQHGFCQIQRDNASKAVLDRTPLMEADLPNVNDGLPVAVKQYWPHAKPWCRTRDMVKSLRDYNADRAESQFNKKLEEFQKRHQEAVKKNREWIEFCVALHKWNDKYRETYIANKLANDQFTKDIAKKKPYPLSDLQRTTFGALHRIRTRCLEPLTTKDFNYLAPKIKEELAALAEKRKRSERGASYRAIREAIEDHYHQLRSESPKLILPPFATFRRLPTLASLLTLADGDTSKSIQEILRKDGVRAVIKTELAKWETEARKQMAGIVGYSDWAPEEGRGVHPCDRVTTWVLCRDCSDQAVRYEREIESLTFAKACAHECNVPKGEKRKYVKPWDPSNFVKDEKATASAKKFLDIFDSNEAIAGWGKRGSTTKMKRAKCLTCKPLSVLTFNDAIGHSHRHDNMEITPVDDGEMEKLEPLGPIEPGSAKKLMERRADERDTKDCGCRYCLSDIALKSPEIDLKESMRRAPKMSVNGLRSHLKAKHGFVMLRDEDIVKL